LSAIYQIKTVTLTHKNIEKKRLVITFNDQSYELVADYLMADAPLLSFEIIQVIEAVLNGQNKAAKWAGNRTELTINPDTSIIEDLFEQKEAISVETNWLYEMTVLWQNQLNELN